MAPKTSARVNTPASTGTSPKSGAQAIGTGFDGESNRQTCRS